MCNNELCSYPPVSERYFSNMAIEGIVRLNSDLVEEICLSCPDAVIKALNAGDFGFVSQGIFNKNRERIKSELLARIFINNKSISPSVFIPIIEWVWYKNTFDYMVVEKAFKTIREKGLEGHFSININPSTLMESEKFFKELRNLTARYGINPGNITIELLEREKVTDFFSLNASIRMLQLIGFSVAIDDYHPIGNNNAFAIKHIRGLDMVKFDGVYVESIFERNISNTESLRKELSLELDEILLYHPESIIVFERIETESMFQSLSTIDPRINLFQGYYFDKGTLIK